MQLHESSATEAPETRVIFVRHGETVWNTENRMMGQLNSPLTTKGQQQVLALGQRLKPYPVSALYSSDLGRAVQCKLRRLLQMPAD